MGLDEDVEREIARIASEHMARSRPGWGNHMYAAVFYMKELISREGGDSRVLIPTMYFHDIGYDGLLDSGYSLSDNLKVKADHMVVGAQMSRNILTRLKRFSEEEIEEVANLISIHDDLTQINGPKIQLVFEADSLAQIDVDRVKPSFEREDYLNFLSRFKTRRIPLFKTETGKGFLGGLLIKAESYYA